MRFRRRFPNFVDVAEGERLVYEYETQEQLFAYPFLSQPHSKDFFRYSVGDDKLMVEYDQGLVWYVIGYFLDGLEGITLPKFEPKYKDGPKVVKEKPRSVEDPSPVRNINVEEYLKKKAEKDGKA